MPALTVHQRLALARQHLSDGRLADAEILGHAILQEVPGDVDTRCLLGSVRHRQGKLAEAVALFSEAIRVAPGHLMANLGIAEALRDLRRPAVAEPHYRAAVQLSPDYAPAHYGLGLVLRDRLNTHEAIACFRETIRLQPQHADAHICLGFLLLSEGRTSDARENFQTALRLDPNNVGAFSGLSRLAAAGQYCFSDEALGRLETVASRRDGPIKQQISLYFALARVCEQAGAYDPAFAHYRRANELLKDHLRAVGMAYDPARHTQLVNGLIAVLTPEYFERVRSFGVDSDVPVFVVGMPRSGTTLAEQILASHPLVCGAGELQDIGQIVMNLAQRLGGPQQYPDSLRRLDPGPVRALAEEFLRRLRQCGGAATRVVDKMPLNYQHLGVIAALFPRARVVHCRRDPIDTCLSCYFQDFASPLPFGSDLTHLGYHYREYERLMAHYNSVLPLPLFELRYEELVNDQETVSRRLLDFCGLAWNDACLRFHETARTVNASNALQVRQPLYRSSVGRWKRYEAYLAPLLEALGHAADLEQGRMNA
jgi:tetratricopeptide (TPR) repeat protein